MCLLLLFVCAMPIVVPLGWKGTPTFLPRKGRRRVEGRRREEGLDLGIGGEKKPSQEECGVDICIVV